MKLATLNNGSRDGQLVVVSKDLTRCENATVTTMRDAIDNWQSCEPQLQALYGKLNSNEISGSPFDPKNAMAPMPRATQWADGSAYVNHVELVRKSRGVAMPESFWQDPLMYMGAPDAMLGPHDDIECASEEWGIDFEAEVAVMTDDMPQGISPGEAAEKIRLIMILNDISFRALIAPELQKGFGFFQSKGPTAFAPVAITPDELGENWKDGMVHGQMLVEHNGQPFGKANTHRDMIFNFPQLLAHAAKTRNIGAGTIIGSGTISNKNDDGSPGNPIGEGGKGYSCLAEIRVIETINNGAPETAFMKFGDRVKIEMKDDDGKSIFGIIDQKVIKHG